CNRSSLSNSVYSFCIIPHQPRPTLFPYTTLFRSDSKEKGDSKFELEETLKETGDKAVLHLPVSSAFTVTEETDLSGSSSEGLLRSEEHTSELQSRFDLVCRLLLEKKKCRVISMCT